ncbi:hypothetical protein CLV99_2116 [Sphingobacterium yanglingense]|uniref:Uncharacterized protein n=1 Tax=Sphingobacterium yanglingense TaxID=1437280 RepID=A0A4V3DDV5_9SPHI|nr:hypothetical protein CLV99_2116 [Sphingobacterium yanglingense]
MNLKSTGSDRIVAFYSFILVKIFFGAHTVISDYCVFSISFF